MENEVFLFPTSFAQQRIWFLTQLEPESPAYNIPVLLRLTGELRKCVMEQSLNEIIRRHEALRTTFVVIDGKPAQLVTPSLSLSLPVEDLSLMPKNERQVKARHLATAEAQRPFDLERGPLLRAALTKLDDQESELILTMHHIISDGWSLGVFLKELMTLYRSFASRQPSPLGQLAIQYADYVIWQREWLATERVVPQLTYWKEQLKGELPVLDLPPARTRQAVQTSAGAKQHLTISPALTEDLKQLSRQEGVTLFMTLLAAFQTLLFRYSSQQDITVGSTIAGRNTAEVEELIGCFLNTLVLRTDFAGNPSCRELLARVREVTLKAYANQDVPVELLLQELQPERHLSHNPLFQVMFIFQNTPFPNLDLPELGVDISPIENGTAKFDLTLDLTEQGSGLEGWIEFNSDKFESDAIARMIEHFQILLASFVVNTDTAVSRLPLMSAVEREQILTTWNPADIAEAAVDSCVHPLVERQAEKTPEGIAVEFVTERLTYRELNERANLLAHHLQELGVGPEVLVAILMERSIDMIVGLLGILKAGGAYVPLDPRSPPERLCLILQDSAAPVVITQEKLATALVKHDAKIFAEGLKLFCIDSQWLEITVPVKPRSADPSTPENLAYVIYTSGSTGTPKGVTVQHKSLASYSATAARIYQLESRDRILQFASLSFDASAEEIFPCLMSGATLVLRTEEMLGSAARFLDTCREWEVSVLDLPTAYWHELAQAVSKQRLSLPASLRLIIIGGEQVLPERFAEWTERFGADVRLLNTYGPTETTIVATIAEMSTNAGENHYRHEVPIGRPVPSAQAYVLDDHQEIVPIGVVGELHLGGHGVARGYLNQPALTAARFIPHPYSVTPGARLYKTGDLARRLSDGQLEFFGRLDHQVKLRGYRIELGEIEATLYQHPSVRQTVVTLKEQHSSEKRLIAYVSLEAPDTATAGDLRSYLKELLPEYMLPSVFVFVDELPLTSSGKVDRRLLPAPDLSRPELAAEFVAPRTLTEELIAGIWMELLSVERLGVFDNFFELGGHSLLATQVIARLRDVLGVELPLRAIFETPTVSGLAKQVEAERQSEPSGQTLAIERVPRDGPLPLSFSQERLWFLSQLDPDNVSYHVPRALKITGPLNIGLVEQTFTELVRRHEILRTTFPTREGRPVQFIHEPRKVSVPVIDLQSHAKDERQLEVQQFIANEGRMPFDLAEGPLIRLTLLRTSDQEHVLVLAEHHLIHDGWTQGVLIREFLIIYSALAAGQPSPLPELSIQYADFASWQRQWLRGEVLEKQLSYWKRQLFHAAPVLSLPLDRPRPPVQSFRGAEYQQFIDGQLADALRAFSRREGVTLFMTMLSVFNLLLFKVSGQDDLSIGSGIANRRWREFEGLLGMIINTVVLRTKLSGNPTFRELLHRVKEVSLEAYEHQDLPFEKLVEELKPRRSLSTTPLFQVMFSFLDTPMSALDLAGLSFAPLDAHNRSAKFDLNVVAVTPAEQRIGASGENASHEITILWEYSTDIFDESTIVRLAGHYRHLLESVLENAERQLGELSLLAEGERRQLLFDWNETSRDYPRDRCIHELFEEQVELAPEAVALSFAGQELTYAELNRRADQIAVYLRGLGVGPEVSVALCLERSLEMVVGLLAILKAGGAYVPLDPHYPQERLSFMLADAHVQVVLTTQHLHDCLPESGARIVDVERITAGQTEMSTVKFEPRARPENLAYIMYTSGSTGKPKGVCITHRNVARLVKENNYAAFNRDEVFLLLAPLTFDASTFEIWGSLLNGARLAIMEPQPPTLKELGNALQRHGVTTLWLTSGLFQMMVDEQMDQLSTVRQLLAGGDVLSPVHVRKALDAEGLADRRLINGYGPTESTTFACTYSMMKTNQVADCVPIGRPLANTTVYLLDHNLEPIPIGVVGELYIGGDGLGRGYLNRPDLAAERFIPDPFSECGGARLYRTGDLARYLPDGNVLFIGRVDQQIKLRGFRIEPGEIEFVLSRHAAVKEAAVVAHVDDSGDKRLVVYLVAKAEQQLPTPELRAYLEAHLPEYMLPAAFVTLDKLPLTPNGKLDRDALAVRAVPQDGATRDYVAPRTALEQSLAEMWADLLHVERVGVHDDFFERGGHSLLATQLAARLRTIYQLELPLRRLFETPTIASLAEFIETAAVDVATQKASAIVSIPREAHLARLPVRTSPTS